MIPAPSPPYKTGSGSKGLSQPPRPLAKIPRAALLIILPAVTSAGRALLLALLAWWTWRFVSHPLDWEVMNASFLHLVNLPFHEAGHYIFLPLGEFMTILGGSLMQVIVPIVCACPALPPRRRARRRPLSPRPPRDAPPPRRLRRDRGSP